MDREIAGWRERLACDLGSNEKLLQELEGHLRDHLAALTAAGVPETEAFSRAVKEVGDGKTLAAEFAKIDRRGWQPVRVVYGLAALLWLGTTLLFWLQTAASFPWQWQLLISLGQLSFAARLGGILLAAIYIIRRLFGDLSPGRARSAGRGLAVLFGISFGIGQLTPLFLRIPPPTVSGVMLAPFLPAWLTVSLNLLATAVQFIPRLSLRTRAAAAFVIPFFLWYQSLASSVRFDSEISGQPMIWMCLALGLFLSLGMVLLLAPAGLVRNRLHRVAEKTLEWTT